MWYAGYLIVFCKHRTKKGKNIETVETLHLLLSSSKERLELGCRWEMRTKMWVTSKEPPSKKKKKLMGLAILEVLYQMHRFSTHTQTHTKVTHWCLSCPPLSHITNTSGHEVISCHQGDGLSSRGLWIRGQHWNRALQQSIKSWDRPATDNLSRSFILTGLTVRCVPVWRGIRMGFRRVLLLVTGIQTAGL